MLDAQHAVLVIVDIQGKLATLMHDRDNFYANAVRMIRGAQVLGIPVLWNEQLPDKLGRTIDEIRQVLPEQQPMVKNSFSCRGNDRFVQRLQELDRRQVLLIGMESHVCVYQTALDLLRVNYDVYVVADAVSSRSPENRQIGLEAMREQGAKITCVEMALFEMLGVAEGDAFRQIIQIVK